MEENKKGAFLSKVEDFAKEMSEMTSKREGVKRGLIILAMEDFNDEDKAKSIISVSGHNGKLAELVAEFATQDDTRQFVSRGFKLVAMKTLIEKIEGESNTSTIK